MSLAAFSLTLAFLARQPAPPRVRPGVPPPPLALQGWVQGQGVRGFDAPGPFLVVFWSLGDPDSRAAVQELAGLDPADVQVVSVLVWSRIKAKAAVAEETAKLELGSLPVGQDIDGGDTARFWLERSEQLRLPTAFIIRSGVIDWIGPYREAAKTLGAIRAGEYSREAATSAFLNEVYEARDDRAQRSEIAALASRLPSPDAEARLRVLALHPAAGPEAWAAIFRSGNRLDQIKEALVSGDPLAHRGAGLFAVGSVWATGQRQTAVGAARLLLAQSRDAIACWYASDALARAGDRAGASLGFTRVVRLAGESGFSEEEADSLKKAAEARIRSLNVSGA